MKNSRKFVSAGLMYLVLIIIFIVAMFPVLYTILGSFKGNMELLASNGKLLPEKFVFDNYKQAWELGNFAKYTGNSIFMAGTIVFGTILPVRWLVTVLSGEISRVRISCLHWWYLPCL